MPTPRIEIFREALARDPANELAHFSLANEWLEEEEYDQALVHYQAALEANPDWMRVYIQMGRCQLELGRPDLARTSLSKAKELMEKLKDFDSEEEVESLLERLEEELHP